MYLRYRRPVEDGGSIISLLLKLSTYYVVRVQIYKIRLLLMKVSSSLRVGKAALSLKFVT